MRRLIRPVERLVLGTMMTLIAIVLERRLRRRTR